MFSDEQQAAAIHILVLHTEPAFRRVFRASYSGSSCERKAQHKKPGYKNRGQAKQLFLLRTCFLSPRVPFPTWTREAKKAESGSRPGLTKFIAEHQGLHRRACIL